MDRWRSSGFWPRDVLPLPLIRDSTYPKNGPTTRSDATKRAFRRANGSLRPKTNWLWKSLHDERRHGYDNEGARSEDHTSRGGVVLVERLQELRHQHGGTEQDESEKEEEHTSQGEVSVCQ